MTLRNNVLAILESTFAGYRDELIESATDRIMWQFENQLPDAFIANGIRYTKVADTPQTDDKDTNVLNKPQTDIVFYDEPNSGIKTDCGWK